MYPGMWISTLLLLLFRHRNFSATKTQRHKGSQRFFVFLSGFATRILKVSLFFENIFPRGV